MVKWLFNNKNNIVFIVMVCLYSMGSGLSAKANDFWQSNSLTFSYGSNYKLGDVNREIITYEHADNWKYGDTFFFTDFSFLDHGKKKYYGEVHPRLSFGKITGNKLSYGVFDDVLLATQMEFGSDNVRVYLYGLGTNLKIPGFTFVTLNAYVRDNAHRTGATYQVSSCWDYPLASGRHKGTITGFTDWAGGENGLEKNLTVVPQFLLDVGNYWNTPGRLYAGMEYQYWYNKFGVKNVDEHAPQAIVKYIF